MIKINKPAVYGRVKSRSPIPSKRMSILNYIDNVKADDPKTLKMINEIPLSNFKQTKPRYIVNPITREYERVDNQYLTQKYVDDNLFQLKDGYLFNKAGETVQTVREAVKRNDKLEAEIEPKLFENILKNLKKKKVSSSQPVKARTQVVEKPKTPEPVEPIPYDFRDNPNWWDLSDDDAPKTPTKEETKYDPILRRVEESLRSGIGRLFSKKNS
jgi:hypothetical protein